MIVFDASGSMWGQIDDRGKIVIAKEILQKIIEQWPPKIQLGLMA